MGVVKTLYTAYVNKVVEDKIDSEVVFKNLVHVDLPDAHDGDIELAWIGIAEYVTDLYLVDNKIQHYYSLFVEPILTSNDEPKVKRAKLRTAVNGTGLKPFLQAKINKKPYSLHEYAEGDVTKLRSLLELN